MPMLDALKTWARRLRRDAVMLWFACRHPRTPWGPKLLCVVVVGYALSPIDLIPDFIPVLGFLDEVLLLPALIWLAVRLLPPAVVDDSRLQAERWMAERGGKPRSLAGAAAIVVLWLAVAGFVVWRFFGPDAG